MDRVNNAGPQVAAAPIVAINHRVEPLDRNKDSPNAVFADQIAGDFDCLAFAGLHRGPPAESITARAAKRFW
jgi:hypothetical protein